MIMARYIPRTKDDCIDFGVRDYGYGSYERHEDYCFKLHEWSPDCSECRFYKSEYDDGD